MGEKSRKKLWRGWEEIDHKGEKGGNKEGFIVTNVSNVIRHSLKTLLN